MAQRKSKPTEMGERQERVAKFYLRGWTQTKIARNIGCSVATVCRALEAVRKEWQASRIRDFDELISIELAKIDHLERVAWAAWERSIGLKTKTRVSDDKGTETTTWIDAGDPRFLDRIGKCIERRCKLLGLEAVIDDNSADDPIPIDERRAAVLTIIGRNGESRAIDSSRKSLGDNGRGDDSDAAAG